MSNTKAPAQLLRVSPRAPVQDPEVVDLMAMAALLSPHDLAVVAGIVRRAAEISDSEGEEVALAVLDQIRGILIGRRLDA